MKKTVCYIAQSEQTCNFVARQLTHFLGEYVDVKVWALQHENTMPYLDCDIYIAASPKILDVVGDRLNSDKPVLLAARAVNIENLDKLLDLVPGTRALVVAFWEDAVVDTINCLRKLGINYLELIPYYPDGKMEIPKDVTVAITPGLANLVPLNIKKVVDVGVRGIDISTFAELIGHLNLSKEIINEISDFYIKNIFNLSLKQYKMASLNEELKMKMEVILNTVDEAIVAVNEENRVIVFNPVAEKILDINSVQAIDRDVREVIPQVDFLSCLQTGEGIMKEIKRVNDDYYIVSTNPVNGEDGLTHGVVATFRPVVQVKELEVKVRRELVSKGNVAKHTFSHIVGESKELTKALTLAKKFARTNLTVLIEGESGTGKEVFAQAIHNYSEKKDGPFVAINFAAIPENLAESELFGYEDGAFTGAKKGGKAGLFEEAHLGTIFLDEIGDASMEVQKRLLRVLEERKVRRVGGNVLTPVDVRVIAATNQDMESLVKQGKFRNDLYYRLCTLPITIPPLQSRGEDIFILLDYFTRKLYDRLLVLEVPLKDFLMNYRWPGNIRELRNVVEYLCSMVGAGEAVTIKHLPTYLTRNRELKQTPHHESEFSGNERFELLIAKLEKQGLLQPAIIILDEIHKSSLLNKGVGRQALQKILHDWDKDLADHKIRQWLKMLVEIGYVDSGKTKQGSKITAEGEQFLSYLKERSEIAATLS